MIIMIMMGVFSEIWVISVINGNQWYGYLIHKRSISNVGNVSDESKFSNEDNFSYKCSTKKEKESAFMKDWKYR